MFKDRYAVGNVCLVVFLAFIFSALTATMKVPPAAAGLPVPPMTMIPQTSSTNTYDSASGKITLWVQLNSVTPVDFGTLSYYVTLLNEDGSTALSTSQFVYKRATQAVYQTAYGRLLELEYTSTTPVQLSPTFTVVYRSVYSGPQPLTIYLELTYKPPAGPPGGGGGGGAVSSVVVSDVGDLTLSPEKAVLSVNGGKFLTATGNLPQEQVYTLPISPLSIRPTMDFSFPASLLDTCGSRQIKLPAYGASLTLSQDMIPPPSFSTVGSTLRVVISRVTDSDATVGFGEVFGSGASVDYTPVAPGYKIELEWVSATVTEPVAWTTTPSRPFKMTLGYDPTSAMNPDRLAGVHKDRSGIVSLVTRTVVRPDALEADLYMDHLSWFGIVQWKKEFTDVSSHWAYQDIVAMGARGIAKGMPDGGFLPNSSVSRAEFAALLTRTLGRSGGSPVGRFKDVQPWAWYYGAVETAAGLGLVGGYGDGTFRPDAKISRQEMATMIVRAMGLLKKPPALSTAAVDTALAAFTDAPAIGLWARESVAQAVKAGIVYGRTITTFQSAAESTRAESVVMLRRLLKASGYMQ
jgi:hypothetical protein